MADHELELYIHIPFCVKKCNYCDFLSAPGTDEEMERYTDALVNEIKALKAGYEQYGITSIFIGGGTPSIFKPELMEKIVHAIGEVFDIEKVKGKPESFIKKYGLFARKKKDQDEALKLPEIEFTVECNPGTLDKAKLKAYKKLGINRLSIGLQSTSDAELRELGRIHSVSDFLDSFELAREAGFTNINVDMMEAVPLQSAASWRRGLMAVCSLRPEHISAYSLIIEEGTPFYERMHGKLPLAIPDEDEEREIHHSTKEILSQFGYSQYEISNYALPGYECRHNKGYWTRKNYLGIGLGSSSMVNNIRWKNISDINEYIRIFADPEGPSDALNEARCEVEEVSVKDQMAEYIFLGMRLSEGITKEDFINTFGVSYDYIYGDVTEKFVSLGLMEVKEETEIDPETGIENFHTRVFLTEKGMDVSNTVFAEFMPD